MVGAIWVVWTGPRWVSWRIRGPDTT